MFHFEQVTAFAGWDPAKYLEAAQVIAAELRRSLDGEPEDQVTPTQCDDLERFIETVAITMAGGDLSESRKVWDQIWERQQVLPRIFTHTSWGESAVRGMVLENRYRDSKLWVGFRALQKALEFSRS